ncbi:MAG TPA: di-heme oxidoredictase family protein [Steroidobacteraceae bacterium]|nr:di-heme oxidoredictase family protein [Steroidobacteraceae bacterium]
MIAAIAALIASCDGQPPPAGNVVDHPPGPNPPARAGGPLPGLSEAQLAMFSASLDTFKELSSVAGGADSGKGLGPRFNLDSCAGCHGFPAPGGSSGFVNPEPFAAHRAGAKNDAEIPFLHADGPVVEARFKWLMDADGNFRGGADADGTDGRRPDGGVHPLFTITGRTDARGCEIRQPPFAAAWNKDNVSQRIPTPLFGLGLIEAISDSTIAENSLEQMKKMSQTPNAYDPQRPGAARIGDRVKMYEQLGIVGRPGRGRENRSGNDSTITRFGWKAQNKSLLMFAGEAYNVEQGVTNELFPNERDEEATPLPPACKLNATPEDDVDFQQLGKPAPAAARTPSEQFAAVSGDLVKFELFMRMLAPPKPACDVGKAGDCAENILRGSAVFDHIYCSACHVRQLPLGPSSIEAISAQRYAGLYSDLLLHRMGSCPANADHTARCLADGIAQGDARGDEFRTAPLWGVGQRLFFLHDGRAHDLPSAILAHKGPGSEANAVVKLYERMPAESKQDLIDFLRSL